jgi:hypothetical protein
MFSLQAITPPQTPPKFGQRCHHVIRNIAAMFSDIEKGAHDAHLLCEYVHLYHIESIFIFCYEDFKTDVMFLYLLSCP